MSDELWRVCGLKRSARSLCGNHAAYAMRIRICAPGLRRYAPGAVALAYRVYFSRLSLCVVKLESCVTAVSAGCPGAANNT